MKAALYYDEIIEFIQKKYRVRIDISTIDERTIEAGYKPARLLPKVTIKLQLKTISREHVSFLYDSNDSNYLIDNLENITSLLVCKIVRFLDALPNGVKIDSENKIIDIYPLQIKEFQKVWEFTSLSKIKFSNDSVDIVLTML